MLKTDVKVINPVQCTIQVGFPVLPRAQLCTVSPFKPSKGKLGNNPCEVINLIYSLINSLSFKTINLQGDSGGPLILDGFQIGIVSLGSSRRLCGAPSAATVYTNVAAHLNWIKTNSEFF